MEPLERGTPIPDPLTPYLEVNRSQPRHECWVTGHMVAGLDGTAAIHGRVGALSTEPDQDLFRRMRQIADVVMVGAQTIRSEGYAPMRLSESARAQRQARGQSEMPPVAVVSRSLDLDWSSQVFAAAPEHARTIVITCARADPKRLAAAEQAATVVIAGDDRVEPAKALQALAGFGYQVVLCEGGPRWLGELVAADRLDELCLSISPMMGGDPLPVSVAPPGADIAQFSLKSTMVADDTLFLRYESKTADEGRS
ncbi:Pyrimidine reductase, riboflavin biosynthesis [Brevibacterium siliguriense]|uniref:Pyrimidine reductase, riboflavin biosynthesis n=1 Tax=Brevibacterium siliguriense TaxID=1136497 RepID=A0A1H1QI62_9MICO|nr:pyrimidine reductase family protein [Brevibacterium siliguriense]SDS23158.1 Pyrimidine reductase, riboflavin biosynthesis [Brevibacterium siliguriense]